MELLTIDEAIKYFGVNSKEAIYNRARIGKSLKRVEQNGAILYQVLRPKKTNEKTNISKQKSTNVIDDISVSKLDLEIAELRAKLEGKDELIQEIKNSKEEILKSKQEQTKHIETLQATCNYLVGENKRLLQLQAPQKEPSENIIIKQTPKAQKTEEPQDEKPQNLKIDLSKKLLDDGLNEKERKRVKARFNKRIGERGIIKEQGKIYISKNENYEDLLKV